LTAFQQSVVALRDFTDSVLTAMDSSGYPVSLRCRPTPSRVDSMLRMPAPSWFDGVPGPASLMCHEHDNEIWKLQGFFVRGELARDGDELVFRPGVFRRSMGGSPLDALRLARQTRQAAQRYLKHHGLERPEVPWKHIEAAKKQARERVRRA
jgi:hypothetical protein